MMVVMSGSFVDVWMDGVWCLLLALVVACVADVSSLPLFLFPRYNFFFSFNVVPTIMNGFLRAFCRSQFFFLLRRERL
jgi:hypothetical protein